MNGFAALDAHQGAFSRSLAKIAPMSRTIELDVRGLEPPEPLVRVLAALEALPPRDSLLLKIDCRPTPLYRILDRDGYLYDEQPGSESLLEITIRAPDGS